MTNVIKLEYRMKHFISNTIDVEYRNRLAWITNPRTYGGTIWYARLDNTHL